MCRRVSHTMQRGSRSELVGKQGRHTSWLRGPALARIMGWAGVCTFTAHNLAGTGPWLYLRKTDGMILVVMRINSNSERGTYMQSQVCMHTCARKFYLLSCITLSV